MSALRILVSAEAFIATEAYDYDDTHFVEILTKPAAKPMAKKPLPKASDNAPKNENPVADGAGKAITLKDKSEVHSEVLYYVKKQMVELFKGTPRREPLLTCDVGVLDSDPITSIMHVASCILSFRAHLITLAVAVCKQSLKHPADVTGITKKVVNGMEYTVDLKVLPPQS